MKSVSDNIRSLLVLTFYESNLSKMKKEFLINSYNLFETTKFVCMETGIHNTRFSGVLKFFVLLTHRRVITHFFQWLGQYTWRTCPIEGRIKMAVEN